MRECEYRKVAYFFQDQYMPLTVLNNRRLNQLTCVMCQVITQTLCFQSGYPTDDGYLSDKNHNSIDNSIVIYYYGNLFCTSKENWINKNHKIEKLK